MHLKTNRPEKHAKLQQLKGIAVLLKDLAVELLDISH